MRPQVTIIDVRPAGFDRFDWSGGPAHRPDIQGSEETDLDGS